MGEETNCDVLLTGAGDGNKANVVNVVRELTGLGLYEAKKLVDGAPQPVLKGVSHTEADAAAIKLRHVGAGVEVKSS